MRRISETGFLVYTVIKIRTSCQALNHKLGPPEVNSERSRGKAEEGPVDILLIRCYLRL